MRPDSLVPAAAAGISASAALAVLTRPQVAMTGLLLVGLATAAAIGLRRHGARNSFALIAIAASGWDALRLGPGPLADLLLLAALGVIVLQALVRAQAPRLPLPALLGSAGLAAAAVLAAILPPSSSYLGRRVQPEADLATFSARFSEQPFAATSVVRFTVAFVVLPLIVMACSRTRRDLRAFAAAYTLGAIGNALVALADDRGLTRIGPTLLQFADVSGRQTGLSTHPNQLGLSLALAVPFAVLCLSRRVTLVVVPLLLGGVYVSQSRAALAAAFLALVLAVAGTKRRALGLSALALAASTLVTSPIVSGTRFVGGIAARSDEARARAAGQALRDFLESPVQGIGTQVIQEGHNIYLQLLAATGLVGTLSFLAAFAVLLSIGIRMWRVHAVARASVVALVVFLAVGLVSNALLSRYLYVSVGLLLAARALHETQKVGAAGGVREARADSPDTGPAYRAHETQLGL